jgi:FtsH-binding integral membrane protein
MEEKQLSEEQSLELIHQMIYESKHYFQESGLASLVGGFSLLLCSLLAFAVKKGMAFPFNPFYLLIPAFLLQVFFSRREEQKKKAKTLTDAAIDYVWTGCFLSVFIVIVSGSLAGLGYMVASICLFLLAFAGFCTGMITHFRYLIVASVICLLLAAASLFLQNEISYLFLAATGTLLWIVPGFMMNAYLKKLQHAR